MKNRIILAAGLLTAFASLAAAQQRTLQLSNVFGQPDFGYVRIPHGSDLEPDLITIEAWITPQGFGQGATGTIGTTIVGKMAEGVHPTVFAFVFEIPAPPVADKTQAKGYKVSTTQDLRWRRCNIKSTALLGNVMHFQQGFAEISPRHRVIRI